MLFSADAERQLSTLVALHHGLGLPTEPLPLDEAHELEPAIGREARAAALLPYEESVDNRALTEAVFAAAAAAGVELHADTRVTRLLREGDRCTGVETAESISFAAGHVVLAAGAACAQIEGLRSPAATRPIRGQMVRCTIPGPVCAACCVPSAATSFRAMTPARSASLQAAPSRMLASKNE